jgi:pyruvate,orthophosphate dikinase
MIPLVMVKREIGHQPAPRWTPWLPRSSRNGTTIEYSSATMIELPRACLTADKIAEAADFFSFGTNDLTQTTFGLSRDDAASSCRPMSRRTSCPRIPSSRSTRGRRRPGRDRGAEGPEREAGLKLGICGEHGGDPSSIQFCESVGLDYVSCSPTACPWRGWPAAQAALSSSTGDRNA